ncbi:MAG: hypothetical protein HYW33_01650 [Candidatus Blackburnbacteria bacterium]|nr:hypothetical protein [Candidatus Blackburnbacteria bacterium]
MEQDGRLYAWWANVSEGSIFLTIIERFARYSTYDIILHTPAHHRKVNPNGTDVFVAQADWEEFHRVMTTLKKAVMSLPHQAAERLFIPDSFAAGKALAEERARARGN